MAIYLKRYGLAITRYDSRDTGISGSARFCNVTSWFDRELRLREKSDRRSDADQHECVNVNPAKRVYGVDKRKLLDRLNAYVYLSRSRKFLAFYSISFPAGTSDEVIVKMWNTCLTNLRDKLSLRSYIWVMERQGNGTMHYHMLTNDYMPIRAVNIMVASTIDFYVSKGLLSWGNSSIDRYNGVDVVNISKRVNLLKKRSKEGAYQAVVHYVTKYMSKNSSTEPCRQWHCSRLVSALFVTSYLSHDEVNVLFDGQEALFKNKRIVESEHATVILFAAIESSAWQDTVGAMNEKVYEYFERHSLW